MSMSILLFFTEANDTAEHIHRVIETMSHEEPLEVYGDVEALSKRLRRPGRGPQVAVVILSSHKDLEDVITIRDLLADLATLLILPDADADTLAKAHQIRPRFLTYADSDPMVIGAVLAKMLRTYSYE
jgi:hypothetical protein